MRGGWAKQEGRHKPRGCRPWPRPQRLGLPACLQSVAVVFAEPLLGSFWKAFLNKNLIAFLDQDTNQTVANAAFIFLVDT